MPAILACCQKFLSSVGSYASPESITVMHQIHDRGLTKKFRQAVASHHESVALSSGTSSSIVSSRHPAQLIYLDAGCSLHDSHNALKWVWQTLYMANEEVLKNLHIALACYRSAVPLAIECLNAWLSANLMPLPTSQCKSAESLRVYYNALGAESSILHLLCEEMRLWWDSQSSRL